MDAVLRAAGIYFILLIVFRMAGKRTLNQLTTFDFILVLIISETTQQALIGDDFSMIQAFLLIITLVGLDIFLASLKHRSPQIDKLIDGVPVVVVENGNMIRERMDKARIDEGDILTAARETQGLERMDQIKYAVLERNGGISIIPHANK